jgi:hypothetical protein
MTRRVRCVLAFAGSLALACGSGTGSGVGGSDAGGSGNPCTSADSCPPGEVCNPATDQCQTDLSCNGHGDCGAGAYCTAGGTCAANETGGPCTDAVQCISGESCIGGFCGCGGDEFTAERLPANMLILLDRSGSMTRAIDSNSNVGAGDPNSRWQVALGAIGGLLDEFDDLIRFGVAVYPHSSFTSGSTSCSDSSHASCTPGDVLVDVASAAGDDIRAALDATLPHGCTPSGQSLEAQLGYAPLADTGANNYILYITDGQENCNSDQVTAAGLLLAQDPPVRTFVVGFTANVSPDELNGAAEAGGTARTGDPKYYQANDAASLQAAFAEIGGLALACTYVIDGVPESADIFIYFDGEDVPADQWSFDPATNTVTFTSEACDDLRLGNVSDLVIVHGCPISVD